MSMSSMHNSDDLLSSRSQSKKRRIPGACDICKRKKIRCDSGQMPGNRCTNCIQYGYECTHKEVVKTLGSAKGYVESLEARLEKMDKLFAKLLPGVDLSNEIDNDDDIEEIVQPVALPRNDDYDDTDISTKLSRLRLNPTQNRFFGKSSGYQLIQTALDVKNSYVGQPNRLVLKSKRLEFWHVPSWITPNPEAMDEYPKYFFPEDDLLPELVNHYFEQINPFMPLLHRQIFEASIENGLHITDPLFAGTVLLVCALGSRYSDDPRVFLENSGSTRSAGWRWFKQVNVIRTSFYKRTSLHELQMQALYVLFVQSTETPQGTYTQIGVAMRLAQEVGAHRKRMEPNTPPSAEAELWKRAFWVIASLDRLIGSLSGRPCSLHEEDFDQDYPLEVDDEYWDQDFTQPAGKPSTMSYFNCYLTLMDIMGHVSRTIYPTRRPKGLSAGVVQHNEQQIIAELDSAMNNWMDSIPAHLKWNPNCTDLLFLKQSAALYATYYHLQIFIHRPFIPSPRNPHPVTFPSLAICTNAARSCCHVLESYTRVSMLPLPSLQVTAFTAAVILLLNIWSGKRSGYAPNPRREMEDVRSCMEMLKNAEGRWCSAGRYRDILTELVFAGDISIANTMACKSLAVGTFSVSADSYPTPPSPSSNLTSPRAADPLEEDERGFVGRRMSFSVSENSPTQPTQQTMNFSLPQYGNELGRLPVYGQFNFSDPGVDFTRDNRDRFPPGFVGVPPTGQFDPSMHMDKSTVPDSLLTAATQAMFNEQMSGTRTGAPQAVHQPMDMTSLFADVPPDFGGSEFGTFPVMDDATLTMWSTAPTNFELDEWGTYLTSVGQMTHGQHQSAGY